jgi:hypothetical protein
MIRDNHVDFIGVKEIKKMEFHSSFLRNLSGVVNFEWHFLPAKVSSGGILVGFGSESFVVSNVTLHNYMLFPA